MDRDHPASRGSEERVVQEADAVRGAPLLVAVIYSAISMERVASAPEVPVLEGRVLQDARDRLDPLGVQVRTVFDYSSQPTNVVLEQAPAAGTSIRAGETVILTVSMGPEPSFFEGLGGGIEDAFGNGLERGLEEYIDLARGRLTGRLQHRSQR